MNQNYTIATIALIGLTFASASKAATFTWNFDTPPNVSEPSGTVYKDLTNTYSLTAYGYTTANTPGTPNLGDTWNTGAKSSKDLYDKRTSGDISETGLGLDVGGDHEIGVKAFIQLDVSDLKLHNLSNLTMFISSIQQNEGFYLWGSNTQGTAGTLLKSYVNTSGASANETQTFVVPSYSTYRYFSVSADGGDVLIRNGLTASTTPEPGSVALVAGLGISGVSLLMRKRRLKR